MAKNTITRQGQRKLNPINVKDPETKNNLELVDGNFKNIFSRVNKTRFIMSAPILQVSYVGPGVNLVDPKLEVQLECDGDKPVDIFLMPAVPFQLVSSIKITAGASNIGRVFFTLRRNGSIMAGLTLGQDSAAIGLYYNPGAVHFTDPAPPRGVNVYTLYSQIFFDVATELLISNVALAAREYF